MLTLLTLCQKRRGVSTSSVGQLWQVFQDAHQGDGAGALAAVSISLPPLLLCQQPLRHAVRLRNMNFSQTSACFQMGQ